MGENTSILVVGDLHFQNKNLHEGEKLIEKILEIATEAKPSFVVILGDTLHYHGTVQVLAHNLAEQFLKQLREICLVFLLIGNHDLTSHNEFLSSNHIFGPFKEWNSVVVVDKPVYISLDNHDFVFCPYVPSGRFTEALDKLVFEGHDWQLADCIFAHQEIKGCIYNSSKPSTQGDKWSKEFPPIISGHIHHAQTFDNVYYPGSAGQHDFKDESEKFIWLVNFGDEFEPPYFSIEKINIDLVKRKTLKFDISNIEGFKKEFEDLRNTHNVRLILKGKSEDFTLFRRSKDYKMLVEEGVQIEYDTEEQEEVGIRDTTKMSYRQILEEIVLTKEEYVKKAWEKMK